MIMLSQRATEACKPVAKHTVTALVEIRKDLGLPIDAEWLRQFYDEHTTEVLGAANKFLEEIKKSVV
jgi:hypothetical protein